MRILFCLLACSSFLFADPGELGDLQAKSIIRDYWVHFDQLKARQDWVSIIHLGEQAIMACEDLQDVDQECSIRYELGLIYFYLGDEENANLHLDRFQELISS
jgi:hypothetical protein